jgi:hypothetical protein
MLIRIFVALLVLHILWTFVMSAWAMWMWKRGQRVILDPWKQAQDSGDFPLSEFFQNEFTHFVLDYQCTLWNLCVWPRTLFRKYGTEKGPQGYIDFRNTRIKTEDVRHGDIRRFN